MDALQLAEDFKEFLKLLNETGVEYLVVGGVAVGYHGWPRGTLDMDIWVAVSPKNAALLVEVLRRFGMNDPTVTPQTFLDRDAIIRMGMPPIRIEVITSISGVDFDTCFAAREVGEIDGVRANVISRRDLRKNKQAAGRPKDIDDLRLLGGPI